MAGTVESLLRPLISKKNGDQELEEAGVGWASHTGHGARLGEWTGASRRSLCPTLCHKFDPELSS